MEDRNTYTLFFWSAPLLASMAVLCASVGICQGVNGQVPISLADSGPQADRPSLRWHSGPAIWQQLWIEGENGPVVNRWLPAADLGCEQGGICTLHEELRLPPGRYTWQTRSWTMAGYSQWSAAEELGVGRQYLLEPRGVATPEGVVFRWMRIPEATWYRVLVRHEDEVLVDQWLRAAETSCVEEEDVCRIEAGFAFDPGDYSWAVQPWSVELKNGVEQPELSFKVDNAPM